MNSTMLGQAGIFTLGLLLAGTGTAATEFEDTVPLELVKLLVGNPFFGDPKIYSDLPDDFPLPEISDNFSLLGSLDAGISQRVILFTDLDEQSATDELLEKFVAANWVEISNGRMIGNQTGFVSNVPINLPRQFCHDELGNMQVGVGVGDGNRLINLNRTARQPGNFNPSCEEMANPQLLAGRFRGGPANDLSQYMPRMELPAEAGGNYPYMGIGGFSGSSSGIESSTPLNIDWLTIEIFEYFAEQIAMQDWEMDSSADGEFSAVGVWSKSPEDDINLSGILTVIKNAEENYEIKFRLSRLGANGSSPLGGIIGVSPVLIAP